MPNEFRQLSEKTILKY
jgi:hypothetical protein